jgi:myo-inositol-1(or 4)-monophosphatase
LQAPSTSDIGDHDLVRAIEAVKEAGELALKLFRNGVDRWRKSDGTPVSEADLQVDSLLRQRLLQQTPDYGWESEESDGQTPRAAQRFWLVDPIDGTIAFLGGSDSWCISLSLIEAGRPILGIIHAPAQKRTYSTARGGGAKLNGQPVKVSDTQKLQGARLIGNQTSLKPHRWRHPLPDVERITVPSLALRLAHVAQGAADGALALGHKHDWDLAAGDLLVSEASGVISDLEGARLSYHPGRSIRSGFIAANAAIHAALMAKGPIPIGIS